MPYEDHNDANLPDYIKKMSAEMRKHWVGAFNGAMEDCMDKNKGDKEAQKTCEPRSFAIANAAVKKEKCTKCMGQVMPVEHGPMSFEEMEEMGENQSTMGEMIQQMDAASMMTHNVMASDIEDKPGAMAKIYDGLKARMLKLLGKKAAKGLKETKETTRTEDGVEFRASDYAVVPDAEKPSTWKLRLAESRSGDFTVAQIARAITAMQPEGFRGQRVELGPGDKQQAVSRINAAIGKLDATDEQKEGLRERLNRVKSTSFTLYKEAGGLRWVALVSNHFRDRDRPPEIISGVAHKEFVEYLDKGGEWPELWLWHVPGTKWGKADFADFADGFLVMSGAVDKGKEAVAKALAEVAETEPVGVSHGFRILEWADKERGVIGRYRPFEVSPLPMEQAANPWTEISIIKKEADMLNPRKRAWLEQVLGKDVVKGIEAGTADLAKALNEAGYEWKEVEKPPEKVAQQPDPVEARLKEISAAFKAMAEQSLAILDRLTKLERSDDEKIAEVFTARTKAAKGYKASEAKDNIVDNDKDGEVAKGEPDSGLEWIRGALGGITVKTP